MKQINLIYDNSNVKIKYSGYDNCDKKRVPVYFMLGKKKCFIVNLTTEVYKDQSSGWGKYRIEESKNKLKNYVEQLTNNDGKYFCFYSKHNDVWKFLEWVKKTRYSFEDYTSFDICNGFFEFHGNLNEYSCCFHYRFYDEQLFDELIKHLPDIQIKDMTA